MHSQSLRLHSNYSYVRFLLCHLTSFISGSLRVGRVRALLVGSVDGRRTGAELGEPSPRGIGKGQRPAPCGRSQQGGCDEWSLEVFLRVPCLFWQRSRGGQAPWLWFPSPRSSPSLGNEEREVKSCTDLARQELRQTLPLGGGGRNNRTRTQTSAT